MGGPIGTAEATGAAPRFVRTVYTSRVLPSGIHCTVPPPPPPPPRPPGPRPPPAKALPITLLTRTPSILCVLPRVSPIHNSIPFAVVLVKANWLPSGLQAAKISLGLGGNC